MLSTDGIHLEQALFPSWITLLTRQSVLLASVRAAAELLAAWLAARSRRQITESPLTQTWKLRVPVCEKCGRNIALRVTGAHLKRTHRNTWGTTRRPPPQLCQRGPYITPLPVARPCTSYLDRLNWRHISLTCGISLWQECWWADWRPRSVDPNPIFNPFRLKPDGSFEVRTATNEIFPKHSGDSFGFGQTCFSTECDCTWCPSLRRNPIWIRFARSVKAACKSELREILIWIQRFEASCVQADRIKQDCFLCTGIGSVLGQSKPDLSTLSQSDECSLTEGDKAQP